MTPSPAARGKLRIAVLNRRFTAAGGGAEGYSVRLVEQLAAHHEIHVFAQEIAHDWPGVAYHRVTFPLARPRWINQYWYAAATWRATRKGFDVVHSHEATWHGAVQTLHVKPVRHNLLAGLSPARRLLRWARIASSARLLGYLALESARLRPRAGLRVVATSANLQADVAQAYPEVAERMTVITPGVAMPGDGMTRAEARRWLHLPEQSRLFLFVANDYARKGIATLLAAITQLPTDVHLAVVGAAGGIADASRRADALGLAGRVHFLGPLADMDPAYRAADALVHPTREDTFAMVVLEAMAHGLPVIASGPAYCGISALLEDGENALLLRNPLDPRELEAALHRLLHDAACAARLATRAREFAAAHGWDAAAAAYERLYFEATGRAGETSGVRPPA